MTITQILIFTGAALFLGWLTRKFQRVNFLLIASVLAVYWLQPALPLRYLDFYLPTFSIGITVLIWALTASPEMRRQRDSLISSGIILGLVLALAFTRHIGLDSLLLPARPPVISQVFVVLALFLLSSSLIVRQKEETSSPVLWVGFGILLLFFIVLKTPAFAEKFSQFWRSFVSKQDTALAAASDIHWLGYSYLAFRLLHTIRDRQSGRLPDVSLGEYVTYVIFFPSFSVGPIERIERFIKGLRTPAQTFDANLLDGGQRLAVGLFKKFVVADTLAMISLNATSATQAQSAFGAWILLYAYTFQIYFDFSGYTDIAIGLGKLIGISLPENFKQPYRQSNLTLFWNNWHMTLTQWFRAYFFNPFARSLRSNRKLSAGTMVFISQLATMALIGLWHGVTWSFVLWGVWHGLGLFLQNRYSGWAKPRLAAANPHPRVEWALSFVGTLLTFHFIALGWVWFVLLDPALGWQFILRLFGVVA